MLVRKIALVLVTLSILAASNAVFAQSDASQEKENSLLGRLDKFGKTVFGGILPADKKKAQDEAVAKTKKDSRPAATRKTIAKPSELEQAPKDPLAAEHPPRAKETIIPNRNFNEPTEDATLPSGNMSRVGSVLEQSTSAQNVLLHKKTEESDAIMPENMPPAVARTTDGTPKSFLHAAPETPRIQSDALEPDAIEEEETSLQTQEEEPAMVQGATRDQSDAISELAEIPAAAKVPAKPLHERLAGYRISVFSKEYAETKAAEATPKAIDKAAKPEKLEVPEKVEKPMAERPAQKSPQVSVAQRNAPDIEHQPVHATPTLKPVDVPMPEPAKKSLEPTETLVVESKNAKPSKSVLPKEEEGVLFTRKGPILSVETLGPRRISVGKESTYEVCLTNSGEVAAEDLVVFVALPNWAEVTGTEASVGQIQPNDPGQPAGTVQWVLGHLDAKGQERLSLRIVPRQNRPFDLAVRWENKPSASQAMIEVQEPKLTLQLDGPREVLYGKKETYHLKLANIGNGAAENVTLLLMPVGNGENVPASHKLGVMAAGEEKILDVDLTARQAGNLTIQCDARADGGVHIELAEKVVVRRAAIKTMVEGPKMQFVGSTATYTIRVRNSGTAQAKNVKLTVILPSGAKYLAGIDEARPDGSANRLSWGIVSLNPETEQTFALKASLGAAGVSRVQVNASADDDLIANSETTTRIESVANLTMEVKDPDGPTAVGDESSYEVRIRNRGTRAAEGVEVFGYFSRGIEPVSAEGIPSQLGPGQVVFEPIASLAPGAEVVLTVRAKAEDAGNHVFRAEAHCKPLGTRLIREATNLYYGDNMPLASHASPNRMSEERAMQSVPPMQAEQTPAIPRK